MNIVVLHSSHYSPNELALLYPIYKNRRSLSASCQYHISFVSDIKQIHGDIAVLSSKWFSDIWSQQGPDKVLKLLKILRQKVNKIIWFDISDSSGTTHFMVLPYVDRYLKNQILSNKYLYLKQYYGDRIYADFIHKKFKIEDKHSGEAHLSHIPHISDLDKIQVGWNSGMAYYGRYRYLQNYLFGKLPATSSIFNPKWISPDSNKKHALSCRIGVNYSRNTISKSRQMIRASLAHLLPTEERLSHNQYIRELSESRVVLSPFGLGEISLRDFETVINGGALLKQNMSHLDTWPNLWLINRSYLHFEWDMSDLEEKVDFAMSHPKKMMAYAIEAQNIYKTILNSENSSQIFCERFQSLIHC